MAHISDGALTFTSNIYPKILVFKRFQYFFGFRLTFKTWFNLLGMDLTNFWGNSGVILPHSS